MARNVIISLLGSAPYCLPYQEDLDHLVTEMERHWEKELSQVLCSKPDLIVVPEACDRYPNFTIEERLRYYEAREGRVRDFLRKSAGGIIAISPTLRPGGCRTGRRSPSWSVPGSAPVRSRAAHRPQEGRLPDP